STPLSPSRAASRRTLPSFPTRRSSDLERVRPGDACTPSFNTAAGLAFEARSAGTRPESRAVTSDRPSAKATTRQSMVMATPVIRSEEHTSELQSRENLVCRLLLEKKKH